MKGLREYPPHPLVGAGAVVHRGSRVLLIRRKYPPNEGLWALPGGLVELGESVQDAVLREVKEETGLEVELEGLLDVQTDLHLDETSKPRYHYVLVDYLARPVGGRVRLNHESTSYGWFTITQVRRMRMSAGAREVIMIYFERWPAPASGSAGSPPGKRSPSRCKRHFSLFPLSHHSR